MILGFILHRPQTRLPRSGRTPRCWPPASVAPTAPTTPWSRRAQHPPLEIIVDSLQWIHSSGSMLKVSPTMSVNLSLQ